MAVRLSGAILEVLDDVLVVVEAVMAAVPVFAVVRLLVAVAHFVTVLEASDS